MDAYQILTLIVSFAALIVSIIGVILLYRTLSESTKAYKFEREKDDYNKFQDRPELKFEPCGNIDEQPDLDVLFTKMKMETLYFTFKEKDRPLIRCKYDPAILNPTRWVSKIFKFVNIGKTKIDYLHLATSEQRETSLFKRPDADYYIRQKLFNYSVLCDKPIYPNESFIVRISYLEDSSISDSLFTCLSFYLTDAYSRYWEQPFFAGSEKLYKSSPVTYKEYAQYTKTDGSYVYDIVKNDLMKLTLQQRKQRCWPKTETESDIHQGDENSNDI
jgi:hypothetical protein